MARSSISGLLAAAAVGGCLLLIALLLLQPGGQLGGQLCAWLPRRLQPLCGVGTWGDAGVVDALEALLAEDTEGLRTALAATAHTPDGWLLPQPRSPAGDAPPYAGHSLFTVACYLGDVSLVGFIASRAAAARRQPVRAVLSTARTADATSCLALAAEGGHGDLLAALLQAGAVVVGDANRWGVTPLLAAARYQRWGAVAALLAAGAADVPAPSAIISQITIQPGICEWVTLADRDRWRVRYAPTALHAAAAAGASQLVARLVAAGSGADGSGGLGGALAAAAVVADDGGGPTIRALLQAGADVDATTEHGETPLFLAALAGAEAAVRPLLAAGASPDVATAANVTALQAAAAGGNPAVVTLILQALQAGSNDEPSRWLADALHVACAARQPAAAALLATAAAQHGVVHADAGDACIHAFIDGACVPPHPHAPALATGADVAALLAALPRLADACAAAAAAHTGGLAGGLPAALDHACAAAGTTTP